MPFPDPLLCLGRHCGPVTPLGLSFSPSHLPSTVGTAAAPGHGECGALNLVTRPLVVGSNTPFPRISRAATQVRFGRSTHLWSGVCRQCHLLLFVPLSFQCQLPCQPSDKQPVTRHYEECIMPVEMLYLTNPDRWVGWSGRAASEWDCRL